MTKSRFFKLIIVLSLANLGLLVAWLVILFLIQNDRAVLWELKNQQSPVVSPIKNLSLSQDKIALLNDYFLTSSSTINFLEQIEKLGVQNGVKLQIGQATEGKGELNLQLSAIGNYAQVTKFLRSLENLPYATRLQRFDLSTDGKVWLGGFNLAILTSKEK